MKEIHGPDDARPGDLAQHSEPGFRYVYTDVAVLRVGEKRLTVRFPDGSVKSLGYSKVYMADEGRFKRRRQHWSFRTLEPRDLWERNKPRSVLVECSPAIIDHREKGRMVDLRIRRADFVAADRVDLLTEIANLADWLAAEPSP